MQNRRAIARVKPMDVNKEAKSASDCIYKREHLQDELGHLSTLPVAGKGSQ